MGVLLAWGYFFPPEPPVADLPPSGQEAGFEIEGETPRGTELEEPRAERDNASSSELASEREAISSADAAAPGASPSRIEAEREDRPVFETEIARLELTNRGGQLISYRLKDHANAVGDRLDLVRLRTEGAYPFALTDRLGNPLPVNDALFTVDRERQGDSEVVTFRYNGPLGDVEKRFFIEPNGLLDVDITARGLDMEWAVLIGPGLRNPAEKESKARVFTRSAVYLQNGEIERETVKDPRKAITLAGDGLGWAGLDDTYFLSAVIPSTPVTRVSYRPFILEPQAGSARGGKEPAEGELEIGRFIPVGADGEVPEEQEDMTREYALLISPEGSHFAAASYWGPKQYRLLESLPGGLEGTVDLGFFSILALPLMAALRWIHDNVVSNYGWAIVLMTISIKLLLLPLTHKSMVSMRKMQELNPKMQAIRQKYAGKLKDNKGRPNMEAQRKMNEEIMGLYKVEGVNPAGGCLPMILQIPVFFAFYKLLLVSVELRGEPWILWVQDLSEPFPALAIIMGLTQFLQQRMMPSSGNEMQRRIMMLMPVIFTVLFITFPAGLVLYWLTNNVLTIVQQAVYNRGRKQEAATATAGGGGSPKADPPASKKKGRKPKTGTT